MRAYARSSKASQTSPPSSSSPSSSSPRNGEVSIEEGEDGGGDGEDLEIVGANAERAKVAPGTKLDLGAFTRGMFANFDKSAEREQWAKNTERASRNAKDKDSSELDGWTMNSERGEEGQDGEQQVSSRAKKTRRAPSRKQKRQRVQRSSG